MQRTYQTNKNPIGYKFDKDPFIKSRMFREFKGQSIIEYEHINVQHMAYI